MKLALISPILLAALASASQSYLAKQALAEILERGAPILGYDEGCSKSSPTCDWMAKYPDSTKLVHMNLPGTHDSATWNYSAATQQALLRYTGPIPDSTFYRCQEHSLFQMLNRGIRVFDLRFAWNPGNSTIGFYHSKALLSPTTSIEDVFFGFYSWLDKHPTEALLISLNHEGSTGTPENVELYQHLYDLFQTNLAKKYWVQVNGTLGTLGQARGKLTLLQRFSWNMLNNSNLHTIGIHLDSAQWTDNGPSIELIYNIPKNKIAYIEDYYEIGLAPNFGFALNIQWKFNATTAHLLNATLSKSQGGHPDQLYITFASSEHNTDVPPEIPRVMALGDETQGVEGVNQKLIQWLKEPEKKGKRLGIVMLDFFDSAPGLVEAILGV